VLRGHAEAKIDEKWRLKLPTSYRAEIEAIWKTASVYVTCDKHTGDHVRIYPMPVWEEIEANLLKMGSTDESRRRFHRWTSFYGQPDEIDSQGRVLIPTTLRAPAAMQGEVVVLGLAQVLEVWNRERFDSQKHDEQLTKDDYLRLSQSGV
jgi:MraZ protein